MMPTSNRFATVPRDATCYCGRGRPGLMPVILGSTGSTAIWVHDARHGDCYPRLLRKVEALEAHRRQQGARP